MNKSRELNVTDTAISLNLTEEEVVQKMNEMHLFFQREGMSKKFYTVLGYLTGRRDLVLKILLGSGSYTDNHVVVVGISEDYWKLSMEELYLIAWGLEIHELFHTLSSNFNNLTAYMTEQTDRLVKEGLPKSFSRKLVHSIANILEDGRIERIAGRYLPGIVKNLQFLNIFHWNNSSVKEDDDDLTILMNNMLTHAKLGIYPKDYAKYALDTEADLQFEKIKHLLPKAITARTHADGLAVCVEVIDELLPFFKSQYEMMRDEHEQMEKLKEMLQEMMKSSEYESSNESHTNDGGEQGSPVHLNPQPDKGSKESEQNEEKEGEISAGPKPGQKSGERPETDTKTSTPQMSECEEKDKGQTDVGKSGEKAGETTEETLSGDNPGEISGEEKEEKETSNLSSGREEELGENHEASIEELLAKLKEELMIEATDGMKEVEELDRRQKESEAARKEPAFKLPDARRELGVDFYETPLQSEPDYSVPSEIRLKASKFKKDVVKIMKNKSKTSIGGQKKGVLNDEDLFKVGIRDYSVFTVEGTKSHSDYAFFILQDGSGSMSGDKEQNSAYALSVIEEGLKGIVPFKVVTFTAGGGGIQHKVVKPWNGKSKKNYAFSYYRNNRATGGNEDDMSIRVVTSELKSRAEKDKVLIVLSDGLPSCTDRTKEAIKAARREGIHVVGIMFGDEGFRKNNYEAYKNMYEKNIISTSPQGIPKKLAETLKKILER